MGDLSTSFVEREAVSVVIPVYRGEASISEVVTRCRQTLSSITDIYEIVLVDDGSPDQSWSVIEELCEAFPEVRGIALERNYGQHNALLAGIREAGYEVTVTLDDDLQNPPEEIPLLIQALGPDVDVVYGKPVQKRQGIFRRIGTKMVVEGLRTLGGNTAPMVSSFRAFRTSLRTGFAAYSGPDVSLDGLLTWQTDRFTSVPVSHEARREGESGYSFQALFRHALTMVTAFSTRPLQLATSLGFLSLGFGLLVLAYVVIRLLIEGESQPGFPFLASIITIFAGAQLFAIGVIGEYIARIHVRVTGEPSYMIAQRRGATTNKVHPIHQSVVVNAEEGAGPEEVETLPWDSSFWGLKVARVNRPDLTPEQARIVGAWCEKEAVDCCFFLAEASDNQSFQSATANGFRPVDTRFTLGLSIPQRKRSESSGIEHTVVEAFEPDDLTTLETIARSAHEDSRFFRDPGFPDEKARDMYIQWVHRGVNDPTRTLLVARVAGQPKGYVILSDNNNRIDLIAVAGSSRREGIGTALLQAASGAGEGELQVVTQAANLQALRLYDSFGFVPRRAETWFHRWSER